MIRILPFVLIPILILGGLWYWRNSSVKQSLNSPRISEEIQGAPVEVPKTLPGATLEDRVKSLEDVVIKLVSQLNSLKSSNSQVSSGSEDQAIKDLQVQTTELKARISALEKATPAPLPTSAGSKYPLYIPMGASGGPWTDQSWITLNEYQGIINPDNYSGYTGMQLEVNFRLTESAGTGSVRLYNVTDGSSISSQADTTSTAFALKTSGTFTLPSGQKTYSIQVKSSEGRQLFVQSARVKVNF